MELILAFFAGMTSVPWGIFFLICIADIVCLETEREGWGTFILIAGFALLCRISDTNPIPWVWNNGIEALKLAGLYFFIGAAWSVIKWFFFLIASREAVKEGKWPKGYGKGYGNFETALEHAAANGERSTFLAKLRPLTKDHKARISSWIGHWPLSMIGSLFGDILYRIVNHIRLALSGMMDEISKHVWRGVE